ncbi:Zinc-type alcohol dehydrogenase-like protein C2E1P3.01 [Mycena sanguinolenta]|uniref:Zinc-type alcohol dehydrogenase-like protein C2E1P3.01 n=1 Tax=Mycena sanguinolenta TaxID=230812 RepID=A0A8H6Z7W6_9AGAR|nr:Zinc-type alcohol dehydrogenase-like protein C2E1P3.01 [Mycena sanguinolenta]
MSSQSSVPTNALASDPGQQYTQVEEKIESTPDVDESLAVPYDYRVYNPIGTARTFAGRQIIYYIASDEGMYALITWKNETAATQEYQYTYTTGLIVTQGSEVSNGFSLGASYEGMSIGVDHSTRTFKSTETTTTLTTIITIRVPPYSELIFYQKRFDFRDEITFINDAWGQEWNIGPCGGYKPLTTKVTSVNIMAEEYFTRNAPLPGSVAVDTVASASRAGWTRKRENVTQMAKDMLVKMGL